MIDAVIPQNNESEFLKMAEKLGYDQIIFLYDNDKKIKQISHTKIKISFGIITTKGGKAKYPTFLQSGEKDQQIVENNPPNAAYGFEAKSEKDYLHQRASALNNTICTFAQKNNVIIIFSFNQIIKNFKIKRAQIIGRIKQNIKLCRKHKVKTAIASFATTPNEMRASKDMQALFQIIGMHPTETQKAFQTINF